MTSGARVSTGSGDQSRITGHAFLSYARQDAQVVDRLYEALQADGIRVWRDTADLWPGEDWRFKIRQAITKDALAFIVCFSRASVNRKASYQNEELMLAIEQLRRRKPSDPWLIPVRFDDCQIPDLEIGGGRTLGSIQYVDLFGTEYNENLKRLLGAIRRILGGEAEVPVDPAPATHSQAAAGAAVTDPEVALSALNPRPGSPVQPGMQTEQRLEPAPAITAGARPEFTFLPDGPVLEGLPDGKDFIFMKFSPDGRYLAVGVHSNVHVWDTGTGRAVGSALRTGRPLQEMAFSPDSRVLVVATGQQSVMRWDMGDGASATASAHISGGQDLVISPDGRLFAVRKDRAMLLLPTDAGPGRPRVVKRRINSLLRDKGWPGHPVFSFDGSRLAFTLDGGAHICDTVSLREVTNPLRHRSGMVDRVNFSPDSRFVVTKADNLRGGRSVTLWDVTAERPTGREIDANPELSFHTRMRFFANGKILALADPGEQGGKASVRFWDTARRSLLGRITSSSSGYYEKFMFADSISISPSGQRVVDIRDGKVCMWNMTALRRAACSREDPGGRVYGIAVTADWRLMATCVRPRTGPVVIRIWHSAPGTAW